MNCDKRPILYNNVKRFVSNPKKLLRFNLNPHLEREECFKEDIKLLKSIKYEPLLPSESEVHCESFIHENSETFVMTEGQLWNFVYSDNWSRYSSLRICEGHLLETILHYLFGLVQSGTLNTYKMSKFDTVKRPTLAPTAMKTTQKKTMSKGVTTESSRPRVPVKIKFTYYGSNENVDAVSALSSRPEELKKHGDSDIDPRQLFHETSGSEQSAISTKSFGTVSECGDSGTTLNILKNKSLEDASKNILVYKSDNLCSDANTSDNTASFVQSPQGSCDFSNVVYKPNARSLSQSKQETSISDFQTTASNATIQGNGGSYPFTMKDKPFITLSLPAKMSDTQNIKEGYRGNALKTVKKAASAELILDDVVFETDYDNVISQSSKLLCKEQLKELEEGKTDGGIESRIHLLDPEEHVITSDHNFGNNMGLDTGKNTNTGKTNDGKMFSEIPKSVSFSTVNSTETACSNMKMPNIISKHLSNLPKKAFGKTIYTSLCPLQKKQHRNVYLRMIENIKMKRLGQPTIPSISLISDISSVSSKERSKINNEKLRINIHNFDEMVSDYSVKLYKQNKKIKELQDAVPVSENKEDVIKMMENFLEMKYIPHLPAILEKEKPPVKLHPKPLKKENSKLNSQGSFNSKHSVILKCFDQRIPVEFKDCLMRACQDFIVRKEQITLSHNWQTLTCVTINRKLPSLKKYQ